MFNQVNQLVTADLIVPYSNNNQMMLSFSNTKGIKNLRVIRPQCSSTNPTLYMQQFIDRQRSFNTLRFMDWGRTNGINIKILF